MKKIVCMLIVVGMIIAVGSSSSYAIEITNSNFINQNSTGIADENSGLTELLVKGKENYEILDIKGNFITSQFNIGDRKYIINEIISDSYDEVVSKFYEEINGYKNYLGQTKTIIDKITEDLSIIKILEGNNVVDSQYLGNETTIYEENYDKLKTNIVPFAKVEYKWHYLSTSKGSTKIIKLTVGAIVAALAAAAGGAAAAGLAYIANEIIQDNIPNVWWTRADYAYNQRCPDWPSYPNWIPAGKYRYKTKYYSNSSRTKYIGSTDYTNG